MSKRIRAKIYKIKIIKIHIKWPFNKMKQIKYLINWMLKIYKFYKIQNRNHILKIMTKKIWKILKHLKCVKKRNEIIHRKLKKLTGQNEQEENSSLQANIIVQSLNFLHYLQADSNIHLETMTRKNLLHILK